MDLWVQSGHAANYREDMFILEVCFFQYLLMLASVRMLVRELKDISLYHGGIWTNEICVDVCAHVIITFMNDLCGRGPCIRM